MFEDLLREVIHLQCRQEGRARNLQNVFWEHVTSLRIARRKAPFCTRSTEAPTSPCESATLIGDNAGFFSFTILVHFNFTDTEVESVPVSAVQREATYISDLSNACFHACLPADSDPLTGHKYDAP
jgi:hypothetical protein